MIDNVSPEKTDLSRGLSGTVNMTCPSLQVMVRDFFFLFLESRACERAGVKRGHEVGVTSHVSLES